MFRKFIRPINSAIKPTFRTMSSISDRRRALENQYFQREQKKLIENLKKKLNNTKKELSIAKKELKANRK